MLTVAEVSGLIAASVMTVQFILPAALAVILVKYVSTENSAVAWTVINRTIGTTIWPHLIRADAVSTRGVPPKVLLPSWTTTISAALLVLAGVLTPLGLYEEIVPGGLKSVEFQYVQDTSAWGRVTMPRPSSPFTRLCELALVINCPGQYQGVYMEEIAPGRWQSVETDETSTINLAIPPNYTTMFTSATSDRGNTVSGLFDIQYRRWRWNQVGHVNHGQPYVRGESRDIGTLITQDQILLTEGLIVDMRDNPGIGFRNHTVPVGLEYGGTWSENITWIEPVTRCADTNLSIELRVVSTGEWRDNSTFYIVDRGAFGGLDTSALESPPWIDDQKLDLFGRAHKAARMHNVLVASSLNISLPIAETNGTMPTIQVTDEGDAPATMFSKQHIDTVLMDELRGVGGAPPLIPDPTSANSSTPFVDGYPDGLKKLVSLNYTAISQVCRGYYTVREVDRDMRANNISFPAVQCGVLLGGLLQTLSTPTEQTYQKNLYVCATGIRASIKEVDFGYNGTGERLENLEVQRITDKTYPDAQSQPLWAAEHTYDRSMKYDTLWGMVDDRYEALRFEDGFYTLRAEKLWLPVSPFMTANLGEREGWDALAAASGYARRLGNLYTGFSSTGGPDYTGMFDFSMLERFTRLSKNADTAAQIPSLILTDGLAAGLVGTKTSISTKHVQWPASLAVDDAARGFPLARVVEYRRVVKYDLRYAIPGFVVLTLLLIALVWSGGILATSRSTVTKLRNVYNQTSTGRAATNLLLPGHGDPKQSSRKWVRGDGSLVLSFGKITSPEEDHFCAVVTEPYEDKPSDENVPLQDDDTPPG